MWHHRTYLSQGKVNGLVPKGRKKFVRFETLFPVVGLDNTRGARNNQRYSFTRMLLALKDCEESGELRSFFLPDPKIELSLDRFFEQLHPLRIIFQFTWGLQPILWSINLISHISDICYRLLLLLQPYRPVVNWILIREQCGCERLLNYVSRAEDPVFNYIMDVVDVVAQVGWAMLENEKFVLNKFFLVVFHRRVG